MAMPRSMICAAIILASTAICPPLAEAASCSERNQQCIKFCNGASSGGRTGTNCHSKCADANAQCMKDGCYNTPMRSGCGFTKS